MGVLVNPADAANTETTMSDKAAAARAIGLQIQVFNASTSLERDLRAQLGRFAAELGLARARPKAPPCRSCVFLGCAE